MLRLVLQLRSPKTYRRKKMEKAEEKYIKEVIKFKNGMVATFDENMQQYPKYQGIWKDTKKAIFEQLARQDFDAKLLGFES